jgi:hypothetical protein
MGNQVLQVSATAILNRALVVAMGNPVLQVLATAILNRALEHWKWQGAIKYYKCQPRPF